jgi:hypothetical protein
VANRSGARVLLGFVLFGVGCAAEAPGPEGGGTEVLPGYSAAETEAMFSAAEAAGFERRSLGLSEAAIVAESDMLLDPETLLGVARESAAAVSDGPGFRPQGYYTRGSVSPEGVYSVIPPRANSIRLSFEAAVPDAWRTAIRAAVGQWNPNACIDIREDAGNDKLLVKVDSTLPPGVLAVAFLPYTKQGVVVPGRELRVVPNPSSGAASLKHVAMHELGHVLGFHHPGSGNHIPGTSVDTDATDAASYPTVLALSGPVRSSLSSDDLAARDAIFRRFTRVVNGSQVTACPDGVATLVF